MTRRKDSPDIYSNPPGVRPLRKLRLRLGLTQRLAGQLITSLRTGRAITARRWRMIERMENPPVMFLNALKGYKKNG
jgi:hypothetical protein